MVDAKAVAALVAGLLLALLGGVGTLVVVLGALAGVMDWTVLSWGLVLAFVVGAGLLTYGAVVLAGDVADLLSGDGIGEEFDLHRLRRLLD